jgi:hypothetical protein
LRLVFSEDLLEAGFVDEYRRGMQFFYAHLVELHTNSYILEKVLAFPSQPPYGPSIHAPYLVQGTNDYAVEARMQVTGTNNLNEFFPILALA